MPDIPSINTNLVTAAAENRVSARLDQLADDVQVHIDAGLEAHAKTNIINAAYAEVLREGGGAWPGGIPDTITGSKTLQIGALINGGSFVIETPILPF